MLVLLTEGPAPVGQKATGAPPEKEVVVMTSEERTPGGTGSYLCQHCGSNIYFPFAGGPHKLRCPTCKKSNALEVVHDGKRWRVKRVGFQM
jgi:hypothetical protein